MNQLPSLTIVTPSFNQAAYIREALDSVAEQGYPKLEHLVIDGGSKDGTVDILRDYGVKQGLEHLRWISEPDTGQSNALNKGFAKAAGDLVGWLNSDDRYRPDCFQHVARVFAENPGLDVLYGDYTWIDESGKVFRIRREIEFSYFVLLYHRVLYIPSTATFFRRRIFDEGNWLDESLHYAMDFEYFVRLASRGYRFMHVPKLMADFRFQRESKTCTDSHKQFEEIDHVVHRYSPVLRSLRTVATRRMTTAFLRSCAGALRYSEKLARGYYFNQSRPATLDS